MFDHLMITLAAVSLAGLLAGRLVKFRLSVKAKAYDTRRRQAKINQQLGCGHPPSWHGSGEQQKEFFAGVHGLATRKGVPGSYAQAVLAKEVNARRLNWYVGLLEDQDASWSEQQMAVAEQLVEWWVPERATFAHFEEQETVEPWGS